MKRLAAIAAPLIIVALASCGAPPRVHGTFFEDSSSEKTIVFPIGETQTAEVGEKLYEQGTVSITRTRRAKLLAPVTSTLDLGHKLQLPIGSGGPLLTRSQAHALALCFPTTGVGQAVTHVTGTGLTIACLVDVDKDGTFDYSMFSTREKYFDLSAKTPYSVEIIETAQVDAERKGALRVDFLYQGFAKGVLRFSYREFRDGIARPAFTQDLTYDAEPDGSASIGFRGLRLRVLKATNQNITYVVDKGITL